MTKKCLTSLATAVLTAALFWTAGCSFGRPDLTYIPFDENHGNPTIGKQAESAIPDAMGERLERLDRRLEAWIY